MIGIARFHNILADRDVKLLGKLTPPETLNEKLSVQIEPRDRT